MPPAPDLTRESNRALLRRLLLIGQATGLLQGDPLATAERPEGEAELQAQAKAVQAELFRRLEAIRPHRAKATR